MQILILPTTEEATSNTFSCNGNNTISICCNALQNDETVTLQVYDSANQIWSNAKYNSTSYVIDANNNFMVINLGPQTLRIVKSATTDEVGVNCNSEIMLGGFSV